MNVREAGPGELDLGRRAEGAGLATAWAVGGARGELQRRAEAAGLALAYEDCWGETREVPDAALHDLLEALPPAATVAAPPGPLPPVIVLREGGDRRLHIPPGAAAEITLEDGRRFALDGDSVPPDLPWGYHRLLLPALGAECALVCCPDTCWQPPALQAGGRCWGVVAQLYALRSARNWGIGDFGDLKRLVEVVGTAGGAFVGLNPLHTLNLQFPADASPYSPSSRRWLHPLYIDVDALLDTPPDAALAQRLQALRAAPLVDYAAVAALKLAALRRAFERFEPTPAFTAFVERHGEALRRHALYEALQAHLHAQDASVWGWPAWPADLRDVHGEAAQRFADAQARELDFHAWLQWVADTQLEACAQRAAELGMPVGLYRDLAVGAAGGGADTWSEPEVHALGVRVGAPPDPLGPQGQDWGLPPLDPQALRAAAYRPFVQTLRANMRAAGALRIDHVMALMRLFWIHPDHGAANGTYKRYPHEDLMAIVALESRRARCLVIGEDLGTVPPAMREAMRAHGLLSYCPLYFERDEEGDFKAPPDWPAEALAVVSTHDLPTLAGWWREEDIRVRESLGLYADARQRDRARVERVADKLRLELALQRDGLDPGEGFVEAVHAWLARTPAKLLGVQLEDVLEQAEAVNVPGTVHEQPNWRRKLALDLDTLAQDARWQRLAERLRAERPAWQPALPDLETADVPRATYRVQLHAGFGFADAQALLPHLAALGVSHLYTSPLLAARPGSTHGYDGIDPTRLNPELGSEADFEALCDAARALGLKLLVDIVPNHMGVHAADNPWWQSVLELGRDSPHAGFFDIDWSAGKVLVPVLGAPYGEVLARGELTFEAGEGGRCFLRYYEHRLPIDPRTTPPEPPADAQALDALIQRQHWRLAHWRLAGHEVNYRRFFDVNDLAALRVERPEVFEAVHARLFEWLRQGRIHGLRVDHPDGLADPAAYFARLQRRHAALLGRAAYLPVEKILADDEALPAGWPVHGDTGYRFAADACAVLVDTRHEAAFDALYADLAGPRPPFVAVLQEAKRRVIAESLAADRDLLVRRAHAMAQEDRSARDCSRQQLRDAVTALACGFEVYRTYFGEGDAAEADLARLAQAGANARAASPASLAGCIDWLERLLRERRDAPALAFVQRFQQFTAPVMAKAMEDTAFYRHHRLVCLNDVGADPRRFGLTVPEFHARNAERAARTPHTLLATSTHDSKRSEDVRARLAVLSEMPERWRDFAARWIERGGAVEPNDQVLLLQTLVGLWSRDTPLAELRRRVKAYMDKALREAKQRTSWLEPDPAYEAAMAAHVERLLAPNGGFLAALDAFVAPLAAAGALNSLTLAACKLAAPGVPDVYQGNEGFAFQLVDPDNRRVPDFARLRAAREAVERDGAVVLAQGRERDAAKLLVTQRLLQLRAQRRGLMRDGAYLPLEAPETAIAFARRQGDDWCVLLAGRLPWQVSGGDPSALFTDPQRCWGDAAVLLPAEAPARWRDVVSGRELHAEAGRLRLAQAFADLTVAALVGP